MKNVRHESLFRAGDRHRRLSWRERLRQDFQLAIISLFGLCTVAAILPLAIYRFVDGDWRTGLGDSIVIILIAALSGYAWRSGRTRLVAQLLALTMTLGYIALVTFGSISVMWAFPLLGAAYLLADRVFASISALANLSLTVLLADRFDSTVAIWSFLTTGVLVAIFGLIFATRAKQQQRRLEEIASRDPLTGAGNRRALRRELDLVCEDAHRRRQPVSLILLDLDRFKRINDEYGHEAGDRILVSLAEIVTERLRGRDHLFRLGGEEFVVVTPGTDLEGAGLVARKLRRTMATQLEGPGGAVTVSMGVAQLAPDETVRQWLARADEALYKAKRAGRDRIEVAAWPDEDTQLRSAET